MSSTNNDTDRERERIISAVGKNYDILLLISKFLGYRESSLSLANTNKAFRRFFDESFLVNRNVNKGKKVIAGHLQEKTGIDFCNLTDFMRFSVYKFGLAGEISEDAKKLLRDNDMKAIYQMKQNDKYNADLRLINMKLFTHFDCMGFSANSPHVVNLVEDFIEMNGPECMLMLPCVENDVQYWKISRVHGEFIMLVQREDGAVLYSKHNRKVYLVAGIASSINYLFTGSDKCSNKFIGKCFETTLLPWNGHIVYDGNLLQGPAKMTYEVRREAIKAYIKALDTNTLITILPKGKLPERVKRTLHQTADVKKKPFVKTLEIARKVDIIASFPIATDGHDCVVFRRIGYTEEANPGHMVIAMIPSKEEIPIPMSYMTLSPTLEDFLDKVIEFTRRRGCRSKNILVDEITIVEHAAEALKEIPSLRIDYYPPPSTEERAHSDRTNPYFITCDYEYCRQRGMCMRCPCHSRMYCSKVSEKRLEKT